MHDHPQRRSPRIPRFDYASSASYLVTICTQYRAAQFGAVAGGTVALNDAGEMVAREWIGQASITGGYEFGPFIVMPDHLHGIVHVGIDPGVTPIALDRFIGAFKSRTTVEYIRGVEMGGYPPFRGRLWQRSFYDRLLRTDREIETAIDYIESNPERWEQKRQTL